MEWLNLHTSLLDSPQVLGAEPIDRGTWLMLLRYCIGQENSGIIRDCKSWKDRKWQQIVRVTQAETQAITDLWQWQGNDLYVYGYPHDKQTEVQRLRSAGKRTTPAKAKAAQINGKHGGRPPKNPTENPTENPTPKPNTNPTQTQHKPNKKPIEGKGREGKGKERNVPPAPGASAATQEHTSDAICSAVLLYPRREGVTQAKIQLAHHLRTDPTLTLDAVTAGTAAIAAVIATLPDGARNAYLPSAAAFFEHRRWEDDPATWRRPQNRSGGSTPPVHTGGRRPAEVISLTLE
jgi:hypothetical protein